MEGLEELLVQPMLEYYKSSAVSAVSKEWNNLRHMILREAVQRLVPQLQQEANSRLQSQAREVVVEEFMDRLWGYASNPPVQVSQRPAPDLFRHAPSLWRALQAVKIRTADAPRR